jgi:hypothetical protein
MENSDILDLTRHHVVFQHHSLHVQPLESPSKTPAQHILKNTNLGGESDLVRDDLGVVVQVGICGEDGLAVPLVHLLLDKDLLHCPASRSFSAPPSFSTAAVLLLLSPWHCPLPTVSACFLPSILSPQYPPPPRPVLVHELVIQQ